MRSLGSSLLAVLLGCVACGSGPSPGDGASGGQGGGGADGSGGAGPSGSGGAGAPVTCVPERTALPELTEVPGSCTPATGEVAFETAEFCVHLDAQSQTLTRLVPKSDPTFDFAPSDRQVERTGNGYAHLGDLSLRYRTGATGAWNNAATYVARAPLTAQTVVAPVLASAELTPTLPSSTPLVVTREWSVEQGRLALHFSLTNSSADQLQVGAVGVPMVFNNIISGRSLDEAHAACSFVDPYIGNDAGYLQVTRLSGKGPALLVVPASNTPLEAFNPLLNAPKEDSKDPTALFPELTPRNQTFEGFYEWLVHSSAYATGEWSGVQQWNDATSLVLEPAQSVKIGFRFVLASEIRAIEDTLVREQRPVAIGLPGYILPTDIAGKLYLNYPEAVESVTVDPPGALDVVQASSTEGCWQSYAVQGKIAGRARVTVRYADGASQTIHYRITKPAQTAVADLGQFLTTKAWFDDADDPFGRSPSVMTYDRAEGAIVTQTKQAWVCGLGDDGGATWLAGIMKLGGQPDLAELAKYEDFVDQVVWGGLQYDSGALKYGVKRTLFYYEPGELPVGYYDSSIDWTTWASWTRAHSQEVPRSYNYPHVAALYWTLYRVARNTEGLVTHHPWDWYLTQAYQTAVAMTTIGDEYAEFGLMDGSVFLEILRDLEREGLATEATDLKARMKARADHWATLAYPFGSEMAWDSTGQEEVYTWTKYFGDDEKAQVTLEAIVGYTPALPHWGYNGSARRYWDFIYGGARIDRLERMLHHYGSSLNAIPLLSEYRDHPDDLHLLRIGYAGMMGPLANIDAEGFPSMAFHAFPQTLDWEARTGDYGLAFFGHASGSATYLIQHPEFGWNAFGGNVEVDGTNVSLTPRDSFRQRVYLAPFGLWLTLDAGQFEELRIDTATGRVEVQLAPSDAHTTSARLRIEQPAAVAGVGTFAVEGNYAVERGASVIPLDAAATVVGLVTH